MGVCKKVPYRDTLEVTGKKPIGVKWVEVLKTSRKHRSWLVFKEFNNGDGPDMYAPTPPLGE